MTPIFLYTLSFFLGSVPFGYLIARSRGVDIMSVGSGNIGATNVGRVLGPKLGGLVLFLDAMKGMIPAILGFSVLGTHEHAMFCGLTAVIGHTFSPFLKFKGGKGVATSLGMLLGATPMVAVFAACVFLPTLAISRFVSLASILTGIALPIIGWSLGLSPTIIAVLFAVGIFLVYKHRSNLKRLRDRTETKTKMPWDARNKK
ncbi:MAG: glycerol-3-phosphate 1-O-acyltransferase PlsY [Armatimonadetes bacterium]|nr:glycerol-3-phosphate 1-O-acyltransferase PlsY [Armatimonadota bacterium]